MYAGMGHQQVRVFGKTRRSFRMVDVVMRTSYIKNFRLLKVYNSKVIAFLKKYQESFNGEWISPAIIDALNAIETQEIKEMPQP
jgi:hypothetical protein